MFSANLKRGSLELMILSVLAGRSRHGYDIGRLLEQHSGGRVAFHVSTLYTILDRMEHRGWIRGRWVEKRGKRRRCYYTLTPTGREALARQRQDWKAFSEIVNEVIGASHA